jgi:uncharacterized membrane protein
MAKEDWLFLAFLIIVGVLINTVALKPITLLADSIRVIPGLLSLFAIVIPGVSYTLISNKLYERKRRKELGK